MTGASFRGLAHHHTFSFGEMQSQEYLQPWHQSIILNDSSTASCCHPHVSCMIAPGTAIRILRCRNQKPDQGCTAYCAHVGFTRLVVPVRFPPRSVIGKGSSSSGGWERMRIARRFRLTAVPISDYTVLRYNTCTGVGVAEYTVPENYAIPLTVKDRDWN